MLLRYIKEFRMKAGIWDRIFEGACNRKWSKWVRDYMIVSEMIFRIRVSMENENTQPGMETK